MKLVEGGQKARRPSPPETGVEQLEQIGAQVEQARGRHPLPDPQDSQTSARAALDDRAHQGHPGRGRIDAVVRGPGLLHGVLQRPDGLPLGQGRPPGQVLGADGPMTGGVAAGDLGQSRSVPRTAPDDPGPDRPAVGAGELTGVDHQMLVTGPRPLDQNPLGLEADQKVTAPVGRDVRALEGPHETGLAPDLQQLGARQRPVPPDRGESSLRGAPAQGLVDAELGLRAARPRIHAVPERRAQPVVIGGCGDMNGAAHGPGADQVPALEGARHIAAGAGRGAHDQGVRHGGDLLSLNGELAAHRLDGRRRGGGLDQPMGDDPQQRHLTRQGGGSGPGRLRRSG